MHCGPSWPSARIGTKQLYRLPSFGHRSPQFYPFPRYSDVLRLSYILDIYLNRSRHTPLTLFILAKTEYANVEEARDPFLAVFDLLGRAFAHQRRVENVSLTIFVGDPITYTLRSLDRWLVYSSRIQSPFKGYANVEENGNQHGTLIKVM